MKIIKNLKKICRFFNSTFASWFFPSVCIFIIGWWISNQQSESLREKMIKEEVELRCSQLNESAQLYINLIQTQWPVSRDGKLPIFFHEILSTAIDVPSNSPGKRYKLNSDFNEKSLYALISELEKLTNKDCTKRKDLIDSIYTYSKIHPQPDSGSAYDLLKYITQLTEVKR
jgi:hypothetical protein